jgi:hypothetical protein
MAEDKTLDDLFLHTLKDIYYAEKQIVKALPKMSKAAQSSELKAGFDKHLQESEGHIERLEQVFDLIGKPARGKTCEAILGILGGPTRSARCGQAPQGDTWRGRGNGQDAVAARDVRVQPQGRLTGNQPAILSRRCNPMYRRNSFFTGRR